MRPGCGGAVNKTVGEEICGLLGKTEPVIQIAVISGSEAGVDPLFFFGGGAPLRNYVTEW